jgi:hypothetical protein
MVVAYFKSMNRGLRIITELSIGLSDLATKIISRNLTGKKQDRHYAVTLDADSTQYSVQKHPLLTPVLQLRQC